MSSAPRASAPSANGPALSAMNPASDSEIATRKVAIATAGALRSGYGGTRTGSPRPGPMASAALSRLVENLVGYPLLCDMSDLQRREFHRGRGPPLVGKGASDANPAGLRSRRAGQTKLGMEYLVVNTEGRVLDVLESLEDVARWFRRIGRDPHTSGRVRVMRHDVHDGEVIGVDSFVTASPLPSRREPRRQPPKRSTPRRALRLR